MDSMKLHPTVLSFFQSLNEIEYSGNIEFDSLRPFTNCPFIYTNVRRYYKRPSKVVWRSDDGVSHDIEHIIRVDGYNHTDRHVTSKFKVYKEKFEVNGQRYSFTGSIESTMDNSRVDNIIKPHSKMSEITFWHLSVLDKYVFRVAFHRNVDSNCVRCNIECETPIAREEFVSIFEFLKNDYIYQNDTQQTIDPMPNLACGYKLISIDEANTIDSPPTTIMNGKY